MGRYITTTGTAGAVVRQVTGAYTAVVNDRILANSTGGAFSITLPATGIDGDTIQIIDIGGNAYNNNITVLRNGNRIQNIVEDMVINVNFASVTLVYVTAYSGWIIAGS
jgi:hypothetical protein